MPLVRGTRCGPYEILAPLGAGGMGEVYRARDTRLHRDVAIKALPAEFANDAERLARFQREARVLASLNHSNIAAIYGLEEADAARYLVLEIVEGESLAQRLAPGPLPVEEALTICAQIAAGVSAAHDAGVIHRDLKPGNVMLRPDGSVKVLDFGLAKESEAPGSSSDLSASPTITVGTQTGVVLGTAAYMSPEQARGRGLDKRTDIWSFGCILYECLTGRQVFREESGSDTIASIIRSDPDWSLLPAETPARVRDLLRRCLQKDPKRRLHDIADARLELEEALASPSGPAATEVPGGVRPGRVQPIAWIGAGLLAGGLLGAILFRALSPRPVTEALPAIHSTISLPSETRLWSAPFRPSLAFSPNGRKLVFSAIRGGGAQLYLRDLSRPDAEPIAGTEGGQSPFFSPDGDWLAFFTVTELRKVAFSGGPPAVIASMPPVAMGGTWAADGSIVVAPTNNGGLARLPAGAKEFEPLTEPDPSKGERALVFPQALPGGQELLVVVRAGRDFDDLASSNIAVHSLATGKRRVLVEGSPWARYVEPGHLVFAKGGTILAAPIDPRSWTLTGPGAPLLRDVRIAGDEAVPYLAVSGKGLLAFLHGATTHSTPDTVIWVDRSGKEEPLPLSDRPFSMPKISPDGKKVLFDSAPPDGPRDTVSVYDFARGVLTTLTPEPGRHFAPIWLPNGRRIVYTAFESGYPRLAWKASDGSGEAEFLSSGKLASFPSSVSPDGKTLLYTASGGSVGSMSIWSMTLEGKREERVWLSSAPRQFAEFFSPDGRFVVYVSNESGKNEVYARPYPGPQGKIKISSDGGSEPAWSPSGREIFYRTSDALLSVPVTTQPELSAGAARPVFADHYNRWGREDGGRNYDVSPDGNRFLMIKSQERKEEPITRFDLIANWQAELPASNAKR